MNEQAITGTDGGLSGGIRVYLGADLNIKEKFSWIDPRDSRNELKIRPGRQKQGASFPFITLSFPDCGRELESDRHVTEIPTVAVAVYAIGYNNARWLGNYVDTILLNGHGAIVADGYGVTLIPESKALMLDPEKQGQGGDVWHYDFRYKTSLSTTLA